MNVGMNEADAHLPCVLSCTTSEGQELQGRDASKMFNGHLKGGNKEKVKVGTLSRFIP